MNLLFITGLHGYSKEIAGPEVKFILLEDKMSTGIFTPVIKLLNLKLKWMNILSEWTIYFLIIN